MEVDYIDDSVCVSKYSLSGAYAIAKMLNALESELGLDD